MNTQTGTEVAQPSYDASYVRAITTMGDSRNVVTNQPIFTKNRIKLVDPGTKVDSSMFERLVRHKLIPRIDQCLTVEDGITSDHLRAYAEDLLDNDAAMYMLRQDERYRSRVLRAISGIHLAPPLAFKLTVAHCQRPEVFDHSLRVTLVAVYIALKAYFHSEKELVDLATAAVFHDLGILHVAPDLLKPGRVLDKSERHHLYAHPITAYLILRDFPEYHPKISKAVFEHHERLDGSGYPRGLKNGEISLTAQVLMLAEVANTIFERTPASQGLTRFSVLLRLNHNKFNRKLSDQLITLIQQMALDQPCVDEESAAMASTLYIESQLGGVVEIFRDWQTVADAVNGSSGKEAACPVLTLIHERIQSLVRDLQDAGFDLEAPASLVAILRDDLRALVELDTLLHETRWQLREIVHEAYRLATEIAESGREIQLQVLEWLGLTDQKLVAQAAEHGGKIGPKDERAGAGVVCSA